MHPFFAEMELALGAATAAVCRAGASSLAELAAMRVPAVLVPYPAATDNHQFHNARAFEATGAARLAGAEERHAGDCWSNCCWTWLRSRRCARRCRSALAQWHAPRAAEQIAEAMLAPMGAGAGEGWRADSQPAASPASRTADAGDDSKLSGWRRPADCKSRNSAGYKTALLGTEGRLNRHDAILREGCAEAERRRRMSWRNASRRQR